MAGKGNTWRQQRAMKGVQGMLGCRKGCQRRRLLLQSWPIRGRWLRNSTTRGVLVVFLRLDWAERGIQETREWERAMHPRRGMLVVVLRLG